MVSCSCTMCMTRDGMLSQMHVGFCCSFALAKNLWDVCKSEKYLLFKYVTEWGSINRTIETLQEMFEGEAWGKKERSWFNFKHLTCLSHLIGLWLSYWQHITWQPYKITSLRRLLTFEVQIIFFEPWKAPEIFHHVHVDTSGSRLTGSWVHELEKQCRWPHLQVYRVLLCT